MAHDPRFDRDRYVWYQEAAMERQTAFLQVGAYAFNVQRIELIVFHPNGSATMAMASGRTVDLGVEEVKLLLHALNTYAVVSDETGPTHERAFRAARRYWELREAEADAPHAGPDGALLADRWDDQVPW